MSRIVGVVLAAGLSRRMGRPKQLLQLDEKPLVTMIVERAMTSSLDEVIVVIGAQADEVRAVLGLYPVRFVVNDRFAEGQGTSLAAGIAALQGDVEAAVVLLGDQPGMAAETIDRVVTCARATHAGIVMAEYDDGRGHPVLFRREHFAALRSLSGDHGGRDIIRAHPDQVQTVRVSGKVPADIDTEADWRAMEHRLRGESQFEALQAEHGTEVQTMDPKNAIKEHMPVIGSDSNDVGAVDHLDDPDMIKLTRDENGNHHWIPLAWVKRVDEHVHLDRPGKQAMQEWSDSSPKALEEPQ